VFIPEGLRAQIVEVFILKAVKDKDAFRAGVGRAAGEEESVSVERAKSAQINIHYYNMLVNGDSGIA